MNECINEKTKTETTTEAILPAPHTHKHTLTHRYNITRPQLHRISHRYFPELIA